MCVSCAFHVHSMCILCLVFVPFVPSSRPRKGERSHLWWMSPTSWSQWKPSRNLHKQSITIHNTHPFLVPKKNPGTFHSRIPSGFKAMLPTFALLQILKVCCEPSLRSPRPILQIFVVSWAKKHKAAEHHLAQNLVPAAAQMPQFPYQNCWTLGPMYGSREKKGSSRILTNTNYLSKCRAVHISLQSYQS